MGGDVFARVRAIRNRSGRTAPDAAADPTPPVLTPESVRGIHFAMPQVGQWGYDAAQVDEFLEQLARTLAGEGTLTADDLRRIRFDTPRFGARGYQEDQVDEFLDRVRVELELRQRGIRPVPAPSIGSPATDLLTPEDVHRVQFSRAPVGRRGYNEEEVDAFLDLVAATLAHDGPGSLTVADVQAVRFTDCRLGTRGYQRDEVDAFLDLVATALTYAHRTSR